MQIYWKTQSRHVFSIIATVALLFCLAWSRHGAAETINIAWTGEYWSTLPFRVAADKGFFEREGLQVRFITMRTGLMSHAMMQGDLDYSIGLPSMAGAALRGLPLKIVGVVTQGTGYAIVSKPEINTVQSLKGKKFALNSFGASDDYTVSTFLSKRGLDPHRDVTFLAIGGTSARFSALVAGVVDACAVSSPFEYKAEQAGLKTLVSFTETAEYVKLPNAGLVVTQAKAAKDGGQVVRTLRALRAAMLFIQEKRSESVDILAKTLKLEPSVAERFYPLYREQYNPALTVPDSVMEEFRGVASFRLKDNEKKKELMNVQNLRDWSFAEKAKR
jgi:NitT/TauT family transport system substrate-binding protein